MSTAAGLSGRSASISEVVPYRMSPLGSAVAHTILVLRTDSHTAVAAAIRAGVGIGVMQVPTAARDRNLRRVLPGIIFAQLGTWVVTHEDMRDLPRIRAVFDALVAGLSTYSDRNDPQSSGNRSEDAAG